MARFRCRAPYFRSVPSRSRNSFASEVHLNINFLSDCAEVRCHEDHASRQIHFAVVTESECGLVKNSQQELPQRVVRFLDFIEENEAETSALRLILIDCFLCQERRCFAVAQITRRRT